MGSICTKNTESRGAQTSFICPPAPRESRHELACEGDMSAAAAGVNGRNLKNAADGDYHPAANGVVHYVDKRAAVRHYEQRQQSIGWRALRDSADDGESDERSSKAIDQHFSMEDDEVESIFAFHRQDAMRQSYIGRLLKDMQSPDAVVDEDEENRAPFGGATQYEQHILHNRKRHPLNIAVTSNFQLDQIPYLSLHCADRITLFDDSAVVRPDPPSCSTTHSASSSPNCQSGPLAHIINHQRRPPASPETFGLARGFLVNDEDDAVSLGSCRAHPASSVRDSASISSSSTIQEHGPDNSLASSPHQGSIFNFQFPVVFRQHDDIKKNMKVREILPVAPREPTPPPPPRRRSSTCGSWGSVEGTAAPRPPTSRSSSPAAASHPVHKSFGREAYDGLLALSSSGIASARSGRAPGATNEGGKRAAKRRHHAPVPGRLSKQYLRMESEDEGDEVWIDETAPKFCDLRRFK